VVQSGGDANLAEKALGAEGRTQFGIENLDRDLAFVAEILRGVDGCHTAGAEHATDHVTVGERRFQLLHLLSYVHVAPVMSPPTFGGRRITNSLPSGYS
jgi:hypothetical protein